MTVGQDVIQGAKEAALWTKATKGGTELPTEADRAFLGDLLRFGAYGRHVVARGQLGCVTSKAESKARARCSKLGWAEFKSLRDKPDGWRLTPAGRVVLDTRVHQAPHPAAVPEEGDER